MLSGDLRDYFIGNDKSLLMKVIDNWQRGLTPEVDKSVINQLYSIYEKCLIAENDLDKEIFFVQVLVKLGPSLVALDDMDIFMKRYIKCCVDSAGYDLRLCSLSKEFLLGLAKTETKSEFMLSYLLNIYVGNTNMIDSKTEDTLSQEYEEHQRFIQSNCELLIIDILNLNDLTLFFNLLDNHVCNAKTRLQGLTLLSSVIMKINDKKIESILDTELFSHILLSLIRDESVVCLNCASNVLCMILPFIVSKLSTYLSDLFFVYARLVTLTLEANDDDTPDTEKSDPMDSAWEKLSTSEMESDISIEYTRLFSFIYGLFPLNLINFLKNPRFYFESMDKIVIDSLIHDNRYYWFEIKAISESLFQSRKLHNNFMDFNSFKEEREDQLRWQKIGNHQDIANMCTSYVIESSTRLQDQSVELSQLMETHKLLYTRRGSVITSNSSDDSINVKENTNIEFYKRELLLIKNELNFSIYLKNLNEQRLNELMMSLKKEIENHKLLESSNLNLRVLNNKNLQITKSFDQLKEEYRRFKNDRLNYEELLLGKNKNLRQSVDDAQYELQTMKSVNDQLTNELNDLKKLLHPKDVEINGLQMDINMMKLEIDNLTNKLSELGK